MHTSDLAPELYWLTLTVLMTALMWVPYVVNRVIEQGVGRVLWDPAGTTKTKVGWAERMMRAHTYAVENLVVFAPLVLTLKLAGISNEFTVAACATYFFARLAHYLIFTLGIPLLRIPTFAVGVTAQLVLASTLLGWA